MKYLIISIILSISLFSKEVLVITDLSVETSKNSSKQILMQLAGILDFSVKNNDKNYLKFGDKVTMTYLDNNAENAGAISSGRPTKDLSQKLFDEDRKYRDKYIIDVFNYIKKVYKSKKPAIKINEPREVVICVDYSSSMTNLVPKLSSTIQQLIEFHVTTHDKIGLVVFGSVDEKKPRISPMTTDKHTINEYPFFKSSKILKDSTRKSTFKVKDGYLASGLEASSKLYSNKDNEKIMFLITDGVDQRTLEKNQISKLNSQKVKIIPVAIGADIKSDFLSKISYNNEVLYANSMNNNVSASIPKIPIFESLHQIVSNEYFTNKEKDKKIFFISTLLQNSENFSLFQAGLVGGKIINPEDVYRAYKNLGYNIDLTGVDVQILLLPNGLDRDNVNKNLKDIYNKYFLLSGAKSVKIFSKHFDLD